MMKDIIGREEVSHLQQKGGKNIRYSNKGYLLILSAILLFAFFIRFYRLDFNDMYNDTAIVCKRGILFFQGYWWQIIIERDGPLYLLMHGLSNIIFGVGEVSSRLPSVVAGVLLCALTYEFGKRLFNEKVGLISAAVVAVSTPCTIISRVAGPGMMVDFFIVLAIYGFYRYITEEKFLWGIIFSFALTLGVITKISAFISIPICLALGWIYDRKLSFFKNKEFLVLTIPFWIIAYPYMFLLIAQTFLARTALTGSVISDTLGGGVFCFGIPFYIKVIYEYFSPIVFLLVVAVLILMIYKRKIEKAEQVCIVWLLIPFLFYALVIEKAKPFYIVPSFYPIAILCGNLIASLMMGRDKGKEERRKGRKVLVLIVLVCLLSGNSFYTYNTIFKEDGFRVPYDTYGSYNRHGLDALGWYMHRYSYPEDIIISAGYLDSSVEFYTNRLFITPSQEHSNLSLIMMELFNLPKVNYSNLRYAIATKVIEQPKEKAYIEEVKEKHPLVAIIRVSGKDSIYIYDLKAEKKDIIERPMIINTEDVEKEYKNTGEFFPVWW